MSATMPKIILTVPKASTSKEQILKTEATFEAIYRKHFASLPKPTMLWTLAPEGQTFQAGQPGDLFLAMIEVENGLEQRLRESAMWEFTRAWAEILKLDIEHLMVAATDSDTVDAYMRGNRGRLRLLSQPWFIFSTILRILWSRRQNGYATLRTNL